MFLDPGTWCLARFIWEIEGVEMVATESGDANLTDIVQLSANGQFLYTSVLPCIPLLHCPQFPSRSGSARYTPSVVNAPGALCFIVISCASLSNRYA